MSLRARGCPMERDGKARAGGQWGGAPEQLPGEQGQDPSPRGQDGPGRAAGQESTRAPNHPACLAGSPSWELEGGTAGWTGGRTARRWELCSCGSTVSTSATLKHPVPFLPALPVTPTSPLKPREGCALGYFTQRVAGQVQDGAGNASEGSGFRNSGNPSPWDQHQVAPRAMGSSAPWHPPKLEPLDLSGQVGFQPLSPRQTCLTLPWDL